LVSAGLIITIVLIAGFLLFGGLQLTKEAVAETKKTVGKVRAETKKKIDDIRSNEQ